MIRQENFNLKGAFGAFVDTYLFDAALTSEKTDGGTMLLTPPLGGGRSIDRPLTLLSLGASGWFGFQSNSGSLFGKLGRVLAGIILPTDPLNGLTTYIQPMVQPSNPTLTFPIWDPSVDDLPPNGIGDTHTQGAYFSGSLQLPQPVTLNPGESVTVGMWQFPSLVGSNTAGAQFQSLIVGPSCTITYDDGI